MPADTLNGSVESRTESEKLLQRLDDPRTAAALNTLLDKAELLAVLVVGLDELARRGEIIGDTLGDALREVRAAGRATGLDPMQTSQQLATLIPTLAAASPAINRVLDSPIVEPEPIGLISDSALAFLEAFETVKRNDAKVGLVGLAKATRDDDVQRGLALVIEVARAFGRELRGAPPEPALEGPNGRQRTS